MLRGGQEEGCPPPATRRVERCRGDPRGGDAVVDRISHRNRNELPYVFTPHLVQSFDDVAYFFSDSVERGA